MMEAVLSTHGLSVGYRNGKITNTILRNLDLNLCSGQLVSLIGANGVGKSTLLRTLSGVQRPITGTVEIKGMNIGNYSNRQLSQLVGIVTTERTFAGGLTVKELIGLGRQPHTGFLGRFGDYDREIVEDAAFSVGILHKLDCSVAELSDGERQKAMVAKALAQESPIIILDEPTAFLDVASRIDLMALLHDLSRDTGKAILMSTHDIAQSVAMSDRLWLLGKDGTVADVQTEDAIAGGYMDSLFDSEKVKFDLLSCDYFRSESGSKPISVFGHSQELIHICSNALRRNGFKIVEDSPLAVDISGKSWIAVRGKNFSELVYSFEQMLAVLSEKGNAGQLLQE